MIHLSALDQSPVRSGGTPSDAVQETVRLAQAVERLGYRRYWLAEHHGTDGFAGSAPEILVARVAAATRDIRVGSGGVMLSHYSPLKVAETFRLLELLYPGRIDLGIGRAPGSDTRTARALAYGSQVGIEYFPARIADLVAFLEDSTPATEAFSGVRATPKAPSIPEVWLLGSSAQSAMYAAQFGIAFSFAHFITPQGGTRCSRPTGTNSTHPGCGKNRRGAFASSSFAPRSKKKRGDSPSAATFGASASIAESWDPTPPPMRPWLTPTAKRSGSVSRPTGNARSSARRTK